MTVLLNFVKHSYLTLPYWQASLTRYPAPLVFKCVNKFSVMTFNKYPLPRFVLNYCVKLTGYLFFFSVLYLPIFRLHKIPYSVWNDALLRYFYSVNICAYPHCQDKPRWNLFPNRVFFCNFLTFRTTLWFWSTKERNFSFCANLSPLSLSLPPPNVNLTQFLYESKSVTPNLEHVLEPLK